MDLLWPGSLFLLGLLPLIAVLYIWRLRRRRYTVRYSSLSLIREAMPQYSRLRRHLPFALFLMAVASLIIALMRPVTILAVPTDQTTIILTIDVSRSMCSTDIQPNRIQAAEAAALEFISRQKPGTQIGIVAFSGYAQLIQAPTTDQAALRAAIESLATGRRTAIGSGILSSIDAIAEVDENVPPSVTDTSRGPAVTPVPKGAFAPEIIVLLTDGASNTGPLPLDAAQQAADRGIRVYTIGFGTAAGSEFPICSSDQFIGREPPQQFNRGFQGGGRNPGGGGPGGGGFGGPGGGFRRGIDEETLKQVAAMTDAEYHSAESAGELEKVFQNLPTNLIVKHEVSEVSVVFTGLGALLAGIAVFLSMLWHPLP